MSARSKQLGDILLAQGVVTAPELEQALDEVGRTSLPLAKVLIQHNIASETAIVSALARQVGMPFVDLSARAPDPQAARFVPGELARRHRLVPIECDGTNLVIAMSDPANHSAIHDVATISGKQVVASLATSAGIDAAIDSLYSSTGSVQGATQVSRPQNGAATVPSSVAIANEDPHQNPATSEPSLPPATGENGSGRYPGGQDAAGASEPAQEQAAEVHMHDLLDIVLERGASDLHLTAGSPPVIRVNGSLVRLDDYPKFDPKALRSIIYSILTQKQREHLEEHLELDLSYSLPRKARFRVNVYFQRDSLGAALRTIPVEIKPMGELGVPPQVAEFARLQRGLVLVTGPTGSGKSTTLASLIDIVNNERDDHIMTVEDPIEFLHRHKHCVVNQREVGADTKSFAAALRHVLRQDPDIILIGELRDLETIGTALTAAETGHLVFATLHTQDAPQTIDRIVDVFSPHQQQQIRVQLAGTLQGIVTQQLVPTKDGKGRAVACEVLVATPAIRNLIREAKTHQIYSALQAGARYGMVTMDQTLADLTKKGIISYEMGVERSQNAEDFNRLVGKA